MRSAAVVALDHLAYARRVSVVARESGRTATREVAVALLPELPSIGEGMAVYIETAMPEITDEDVLELIRASCHANCSALLDGLLRGVSLDAMAPSAEVIQTTRALVRYGLSLTAVVRGYQLGTTYWGKRWAQAVQHQRAYDASTNAQSEFHRKQLQLAQFLRTSLDDLLAILDTVPASAGPARLDH